MGRSLGNGTPRRGPRRAKMGEEDEGTVGESSELGQVELKLSAQEEKEAAA